MNESMRHPLERLGLAVMAGGLAAATLVAWLLTKVNWSWATRTDIDMPYYGSSVRDLGLSLANTTFTTRHVAAEASVAIGVCGVILGIVLVLIGKALGPRRIDTAIDTAH